MPVPDGWANATLGQYLKVCRNGLVCDQDADPEIGIPVTRIETIADGRIDWERVGHASPGDAKEDYLVQQGDVLLSHINSVKHIGKVARKVERQPLVHGMNVMLLRFTDAMDPGFGFALMAWQRTKRYMERRAKKAVNQASLNTSDIRDFPFLLPPLPEQRAIAAVLDSIDEAIERTEEVIAATERLRDALLHELLTRGLPGRHTAWRDVPGLGTIPADWDVVRLGDVAQVRGGVGFPLHRQGRESGPYPFIKVSDMTLEGNETEIRHANNYVDEDDVAALKATTFAPGSVVFPKIGAAIATNKKRALTMPTIIDNNMAGVTVSDTRHCAPQFLRVWFETIDLQRLANVSTVPSITGSRLKREPFPLPPLAEQQGIADALDSIDATIERARAERAALQSSKASTADALLTGRVRVSRVAEVEP